MGNISLNLVGASLLKINPFIFKLSVTDNSKTAMLQICGVWRNFSILLLSFRVERSHELKT
jgi:hypothetical protein